MKADVVTYSGEHGERIESVTGYDGRAIRIGDRIELHPATDLWMRGARYGKVVGFSQTPDDRLRIDMDIDNIRASSLRHDTYRTVSADLVRALPETEVERIMRTAAEAEFSESTALAMQRAQEIRRSMRVLHDPITGNEYVQLYAIRTLPTPACVTVRTVDRAGNVTVVRASEES